VGFETPTNQIKLKLNRSRKGKLSTATPLFYIYCCGYVKPTAKNETMIEIKASTPQPYDCPNCKDKLGYKVVQRVQKYYEMYYDESGNNAGNGYSEHDKPLHTMKRAYCYNCNTPLPFNVRL